jgi:hypothetical protein
MAVRFWNQDRPNGLMLGPYVPTVAYVTHAYSHTRLVSDLNEPLAV